LGLPSHLIWRAVVVLVVSILIAAILYHTKLRPNGNESKPQTAETIQQDQQTSHPTQHKDKEGIKRAKSDTFAAITNEYDSAISKELKKANKLLEKGKIEDGLRRLVIQYALYNMYKMIRIFSSYVSPLSAREKRNP
jgi:hypothetical protein